MKISNSAAPAPSSIRVRPAVPADAEALLAIYAPYVEETAITFEYTVPSAEEFRERIEKTRKQYPYLAAEINGIPVGYTYASAFKERAAYGWAVETSVYVAMDRRGRGVGTALYRELEQWLKRQHILNVNACITFPNPESIRFHEKFGYRLAAHFTSCGYKLGAWHDMVWMEKMLGDHRNPPEAVIPASQVIPK